MNSKSLEDLKTITKKFRNFKVEDYIEAKVAAINNFFTVSRLDSCVLGMSGGVDSACVLSLLLEAQKQPNSPIKVIRPLIVPIYGKGMTGQESATIYAQKQCKSFGVEAKVVDLSEVLISMLQANVSFNDQYYFNNPYARGQLACILRTPLFYFHAALLQVEGYKSIVVGTTDRDEGAYIGFYGKASDGMNDLQPIADIHKSEVKLVGAKLGVIPEIIARNPTGDIWDGSTSEEMIGADFDFLEMYINLRDFGLIDLVTTLDDENIKAFRNKANNIEALHNRNKHKFTVNGMPCHFIDVQTRCTVGGWHE